MWKVLAVVILSLSCVAQAAQQKAPQLTKLTWYGHAAFEITTPKGHVLFIDPWLSNPMNPAAKNGHNPLAGINRADYILLTHGHFDHVGNTVELGKKTGAHLVTNFELGTNLVRALGFPAKQAGMDTLMNIGGEIRIAGGEVIVDMVRAIHSSGLEVAPDKPLISGGTAAGFVIRIKNGPTVYDTGDTAYFNGMHDIGRKFHPDVALVNIGGHFDMEIPDAARAAQAVRAKLVIPMHFKTFPVLNQSAAPFFKLLDRRHIPHLEMKPGQTIEFRGRSLAK